MLGEILDRDHPELIPAVEGEAQSTEAKVGPYALQDFTLFHVLRRGYRPPKIAFLAWHAWHDADAGRVAAGLPDERPPGVRRWPRSGTGSRSSSSASSPASSSARPLPNGPKVSAGGTLSPRGDWRTPSDAGRAWLADLENVPRE